MSNLYGPTGLVRRRITVGYRSKRPDPEPPEDGENPSPPSRWSDWRCRTRTSTQSIGNRSINTTGYSKGDRWAYPTPFSRDYFECSPPQGTVTRTMSTGAMRQYRGTEFPPNSMALSMKRSNNYLRALNLRNRSITQALNKVPNSDLNFSVFLAESVKTFSGIAENISRVLTAYRALRHGRFKDFLNALRISSGRDKIVHDAASQWLEYSYAWKPLLADIKGAHDLWRQALDPTQLLLSVESNPREQVTGLEELSSISGTFRYGGQMGCQTKLWYTVNDPTIYWASKLGLLNPLTVAWELVPFSFVIDWAMPIGQTLDAMTATLGTDFHAGYSTQWGNLSGRATNYATRTRGDESLEGCITQTASYRYYDRKRHITFPNPKLFIKSPWSSSHARSAAALFTVLTKR